ncbi:protein boule-like [Betta splendens]|uniref:Protein boule-like n=1 Tax=Betta splendens TaxID=158456 RepID=A0A6P7LYX8_BETSP|nr:protein boule-like [Betta splendens]
MAAFKERPQNGSFATCTCPPQTYTYSLTHRSSSQSGSAAINPLQIFVAGFGYKTCERDLQDYFSPFGTVREVKIVVDSWGYSKGYGFITFATEEAVLKVLVHADRLYYRDRKLSIRQAIYRQALPYNNRVREAYYNTSVDPSTSHEPMSKATSTRFFYTYYNGEAYFFSPSTNPPAHHWLNPPPEPSLQSHGVDNQQSAYYYNQPPVSSSPFTFSQQSEYVNQSADGGSINPLPFTDVPAENVLFPHSWAYLNPKYRRDVYQYP